MRIFKFGFLGCLGAMAAVVVVLVAIVAIVSFAVSDDDDDEAEVVQTASEGEAEESPPAEGEQDVLNLPMGATARVGDAEVTVNSCRFASDEVLAPDPGFVYVVVDVSVLNTGDDIYNLSSLLQTGVRDDDGREYNVTVGPDTQGQLDGSIQPNEQLRGEAAYEVPEGAALQWAFEQALGGQEARWNLSCS